MLFFSVASVPAQAHTQHLATQAATAQAASPATAYAVAVSYSNPAKHFFAHADSLNNDNIFTGAPQQNDSAVVAEIDAFAACHDAGVSDCDVASVVQNGWVALAIYTASNTVWWGASEGATEKVADTAAVKECLSYSHATHGCNVAGDAGSNVSGSPTIAVTQWGTFNSEKTGQAIVSAYRDIGQKIDVGNCLVFAQAIFGWTHGGEWTIPPGEAGSAQAAFNYLLDNPKDAATLDATMHPKPALPSDTSDIGSLVWFGPAPDNDGHVGIYVGDGQFISATDAGVELTDINTWNKYGTSPYEGGAPYEGWAYAPSDWYTDQVP